MGFAPPKGVGVEVGLGVAVGVGVGLTMILVGPDGVADGVGLGVGVNSCAGVGETVGLGVGEELCAKPMPIEIAQIPSAKSKQHIAHDLEWAKYLFPENCTLE
ncbi:MAG TPA: hypothetical protein VGK24_16410 [Candidatus Angelobacter sp.]